MSRRRPELKGPAHIYYNFNTANKYANNSRILAVQREMANRAIELLNLDKNKSHYLLDLGCGSGISGEALTDNGHLWIGLDISSDMLACAKSRNVCGDLFESDLGNGLPFKEGIFDGCISISTLQWLTNSDSSKSNPKKRLANLFNSLFKCLKRGSRAVFQLYPQNSKDFELISECAMKSGFVFSIVTDYPNSSKAKKHYIILDSGSIKSNKIPKNVLKQHKLNIINEDTKMNDSNQRKVIKNFESLTIVQKQAIRSYKLHGTKKKQSHKKRGSERFQDRDWIIQAKLRRQQRGYQVPRDSKYTGRKRKPTF